MTRGFSEVDIAIEVQILAFLLMLYVAVAPPICFCIVVCVLKHKNNRFVQYPRFDGELLSSTFL